MGEERQSPNKIDRDKNESGSPSPLPPAAYGRGAALRLARAVGHAAMTALVGAEALARAFKLVSG